MLLTDNETRAPPRIEPQISRVSFVSLQGRQSWCSVCQFRFQLLFYLHRLSQSVSPGKSRIKIYLRLLSAASILLTPFWFARAKSDFIFGQCRSPTRQIVDNAREQKLQDQYC